MYSERSKEEDTFTFCAGSSMRVVQSNLDLKIEDDLRKYLYRI